MNTEKKYSVRLKAGHPTGSMRRAGLVVTREPQIVSLSDEQLQILQADRYMIVSEAELYVPAYQEPEQEVYTPETQPEQEQEQTPIEEPKKKIKRGRR